MGFFEKLKNGLSKTKASFFGQINSVFRAGKPDEEMLEKLEELLICADMGYETAEEVIDALRSKIKEDRISDPEEAKKALRTILRNLIGDPADIDLGNKPAVILMIGVNGVGKTTSVAKIANLLQNEGKKVVVAAADTFRAAAIDQLEVWCERIGTELIRHSEGSDPAAVVYDAIGAAKNRHADVLIIDTAGRLHNKKNLMDELAKINRVIGRELPSSSRMTLLVLDATTGQNAVNQAVEFKNAADINGLVLTKLDGSAKGGIVFSVKKKLNIPVQVIGVGEQTDDLQRFNADEFVAALFEE